MRVLNVSQTLGRLNLWPGGHPHIPSGYEGYPVLSFSMRKIITIVILTAFGLLWPLNAIAGRTRQLTFEDAPANGGVGSMIISPDGGRIAFFADIDPGITEFRDLFTIRFDGTELVQPLAGYLRGGMRFGDVSWDGSILVIEEQRDMLGTNPFERNQIYRLNYDGTGLTQLTFTNDFSLIGNKLPRITNDASLIIFSSDDDFLGTNPENDSEIYTVSFDGTQFIQLTNNNYPNGLIKASSGFNSVAYVGVPDPDNELFVNDATGSSETRLTFNDDTDYPTSIAGNGSLIAFLRNGPSAGNPAKLFTILPDGTGETQLTFGPGLASGILNGDGTVILKAEAPQPAARFDFFLGPSDGSNFKQINPPLHNLQSNLTSSDLDYSGTRVIFALNTGAAIPNEKAIVIPQLFAYDDTIGDTPTGTNVLVNIDTDALISFSNVTSSGNTGSLISQFGMLPDASIIFGELDIHYEYWTDAIFAGNVEVCFNYGSRFTSDDVIVLQRVSDSWVNITSSVNGGIKTACGTTTTLGEFVVAMYVYRERDYYVSVITGSDETGDGTKSNPWASIGHALTTLEPHATATASKNVHVAGGTYNENYVQMRKDINLFGGYDPLTWQRSPERYPTVLQGSGTNTLVFGADNATIDGFVITGGGTGIYNEDASPTVSNCRIQNNKWGIYNYVLYGEGQVTSPVIKNNVIAFNQTGITNILVQCWWPGCNSIESSVIPLIVNNTLVENTNAGVEFTILPIGPLIEPLIVKNNILWANGQDISWWDEPLEVTYCDLENGIVGVGNISADPLFVDPANGDFHLKPGSPAIDAGDPDPQYNDHDGTRNDMGAFGGPDVVPNTPKGINVKLVFDGGITITFPQVTGSGHTTMTHSTTCPEPSGFYPLDPIMCYTITTSADHGGLAEVCMDYEDRGYVLQLEDALRIYQWSGYWQNVTTFQDQNNNRICGVVNGDTEFTLMVGFDFSQLRPPSDNLSSGGGGCSYNAESSYQTPLYEGLLYALMFLAVVWHIRHTLTRKNIFNHFTFWLWKQWRKWEQ